jgi:hypothetical protein
VQLDLGFRISGKKIDTALVRKWPPKPTGAEMRIVPDGSALASASRKFASSIARSA